VSDYGRVSWLEWPSLLGDTARARVYTPTDTADPPSLIYLHGIGMEMEMWRAQTEPVNALAADGGIRVIRPEGPWHGRRMLPGYHGGEPALAFAPKGYIDLIQAWVTETAQLIQWARATSRGPVAVAGLSLGALTAQIVGTAARHWPAAARPDVMFLVCTSGDILEVSFEGAFARGLGVSEALQRAGWDHDDLARWRGLLEPRGAPVMPPERIVMLLGRHDSVTPYRGGLALSRRWEIPKRNLYVANRGHFSTPLGLHQDPAPLHRAIELLKGAARA
jgi:pimeloyl-ACP methyl ester carboxylesterase